jgi:formyltetrahydrofolate hydrolase
MFARSVYMTLTTLALAGVLTGCGGGRKPVVDTVDTDATLQANRFLAYSQLALERNEIAQADKKLSDAERYAQRASQDVQQRLQLQRAQIMLAQGHLDACLDDLMAKRFDGRNEADRHYLLGRCQLRRGETFEALIHFKECRTHSVGPDQKERAADMLAATEALELLAKSTPSFAERLDQARDHLAQIKDAELQGNIKDLLR